MRSAPALLGLPLLALLLASCAPPASARPLKEAPGVPRVPFLLRVLREWLPAVGTPASSSPSSSPPRDLIALVDAPGASMRDASDEDAGIMPSKIYPSTDCNPVCTGDLACQYRRSARGKVCRCRKHFKRQSKGSDVCVPVSGSDTSTSTTTDPTSNPDTSTGTPTDGSTVIPTSGTDTPSTTITNTDPNAAAPDTGGGGGGGSGGETCASKFGDDQCTMIKQLLDLTNGLRTSLGLPTLCLNNKLIASSQRHTEDMAATGTHEHVGTDGSTSNQRIMDAGFNAGYRENVAWGRYSADAAFEGFKGSPPHYAALVADNVDMMGAYTKDGYWTQDFGNGTGDPTRSYDSCNNE